ncbi:TrmB family transcriptional regulator [Streptomyces sp. NPDC127092]|uniref:TrmB family transcriptional regulator n=1 Tax=Streptomyces sp. NPDC127092 TaxID=3347135 RepID=UPI003647BAAF
MRLCKDHCPTESPALCPEALEVYRTAVANNGLEEAPPPCLNGLELLRPHPEDTGRLVPVPPDVAEHHLVQPLEQAMHAGRSTLRSIREALAQVESVYREETQKTPAPVQLLRGNDVIHKKLRQLNAACRHELQAVQPGGPRSAPALAEALGQLPGVIARGVRHRTLYQHTVRAHRPMIEFMTAIQKAGGEFRTADLLVDRVILYDRSVALIPDHRYSRPDHALLIEHPAIAAYLGGVFDLVWEALVVAAVGKPSAAASRRPPAQACQVLPFAAGRPGRLLGGHDEAGQRRPPAAAARGGPAYGGEVRHGGDPGPLDRTAPHEAPHDEPVALAPYAHPPAPHREPYAGQGTGRGGGPCHAATRLVVREDESKGRPAAQGGVRDPVRSGGPEVHAPHAAATAPAGSCGVRRP